MAVGPSSIASFWACSRIGRQPVEAEPPLLGRIEHRAEPFLSKRASHRHATGWPRQSAAGTASQLQQGR